MAFNKRSIYKTPDELRQMLEPSRINRLALAAAKAAVKPGVSTLELDAIAEQTIRSMGAEPNFAKVPGYSHTICANVNNTVVHGIPNSRPLEPGDSVTIDCGAELDGWHSDAAITVIIPDPDRPELVQRRQQLSDVTERAMWVGIAALARVKNLNQVGAAIEDYVTEVSDYGILEDYIGHGIGREMHEEPPVFNYAVRALGPAVKPGLVVAIEPIISAGTTASITEKDGWTVNIADGSDSCQWEHTVAVHKAGIWVLTAEDGGVAGLAQFGITPKPIQ